MTDYKAIIAGVKDPVAAVERVTGLEWDYSKAHAELHKDGVFALFAALARDLGHGRSWVYRHLRGPTIELPAALEVLALLGLSLADVETIDASEIVLARAFNRFELGGVTVSELGEVIGVDEVWRFVGAGIIEERSGRLWLARGST